jgi:hypothetical protein
MGTPEHHDLKDYKDYSSIRWVRVREIKGLDS